MSRLKQRMYWFYNFMFLVFVYYTIFGLYKRSKVLLTPIDMRNIFFTDSTRNLENYLTCEAEIRQVFGIYIDIYFLEIFFLDKSLKNIF